MSDPGPNLDLDGYIEDPYSPPVADRVYMDPNDPRGYGGANTPRADAANKRNGTWVDSPYDVIPGIGGPLEDMLTGETVNPYEPDRRNFYLGGDPNFARTEYNRLGEQGALQEMGYRNRADAQQAAGQAAASRGNAYDPNMSGARIAGGLQRGTYNDINAYYNQGPGPSAAEAQLRQGNDAAMAAAAAMARSNGDYAAARQAQNTQAATMARTNAQAATLRAQEADAWRGRQLQAMGMGGQLAGQMRGAEQSEQQMLAQNALANRALNDQTGLGYQQLSNQQYGAGTAANMSYQNMGYGLLGQQLGANMGYENIRSGNSMTAQQLNQQMDADRDAQNMLIVGSLLASDRDAKTDIDTIEKGQGGFADALAYGEEGHEAVKEAEERANEQRWRQLAATGGANAQGGAALGAGLSSMLGSDARSKKRIQELESERDLWRSRARDLVTAAGPDAIAREAAAYDDQTVYRAARSRPSSGYQPPAPVAYADVRGQPEQPPRPVYGNWTVDIGEAQVAPEPPAARDWTVDIGEAQVASDARSKRRIVALEAALDSSLQQQGSGSRAPMPAPRQPDYGALDAAARRGTDLRSAGSYTYEYKDPSRFGKGRYAGPMAQELEHIPGVVRHAPDGTKLVDSGRLANVTASAVGEQQRDIDGLEAEITQLEEEIAKMRNSDTVYPTPRQPRRMR